MSFSKVPMSGPLLPHLEGMRAALVERGYAPQTVVNYEHLLGRLSGWLQEQDVEPSGVDGRGSARVRSCAAGWVLDARQDGLRVVDVADVSARRRCDPAEVASPTELVLEDYRCYLQVERRLAGLTVVSSGGVQLELTDIGLQGLDRRPVACRGPRPLAGIDSRPLDPAPQSVGNHPDLRADPDHRLVQRQSRILDHRLRNQPLRPLTQLVRILPRCWHDPPFREIRPCIKPGAIQFGHLSCARRDDDHAYALTGIPRRIGSEP
jgi:hypothetical protein